GPPDLAVLLSERLELGSDREHLAREQNRRGPGACGARIRERAFELASDVLDRGLALLDRIEGREALMGRAEREQRALIAREVAARARPPRIARLLEPALQEGAPQ